MFQRRVDWAWLACLAALLMVTSAQATSRKKPTVAEGIVAIYVPMQEALAADSVAAVKEKAGAIALKAAEAASYGGDLSLFHGQIATAAQGMTAPDIDGLREQFKPLSLALSRLVEKVAVAGHGIYYCPMADAYWVQVVGEVRNPYYGSKMLTCGELVQKVEE